MDRKGKPKKPARTALTFHDWVPLETAYRWLAEAAGSTLLGCRVLHASLIDSNLCSRMIRVNAAAGLYYAEEYPDPSHWDQVLLVTDTTLAPMHDDDERWYSVKRDDLRKIIRLPDEAEPAAAPAGGERGHKAHWRGLATQWVHLVQAGGVPGFEGEDRLENASTLADGAADHIMGLGLEAPDPDNLRKYIGTTLKLVTGKN